MNETISDGYMLKGKNQLYLSRILKQNNIAG